MLLCLLLLYGQLLWHTQARLLLLLLLLLLCCCPALGLGRPYAGATPEATPVGPCCIRAASAPDAVPHKKRRQHLLWGHPVLCCAAVAAYWRSKQGVASPCAKVIHSWA